MLVARRAHRRILVASICIHIDLPPDPSIYWHVQSIRNRGGCLLCFLTGFAMLDVEGQECVCDHSGQSLCHEIWLLRGHPFDFCEDGTILFPDN